MAHDFWIHFVCGFIVGAGIGAWIGFAAFSGWPAIIVFALVAALILALCAGRWGDPVWEALCDMWR
jgi:uncharacterized membrane protein